MKALFKMAFHRVAHLLQMNEGRVEAWRNESGTLMVGFRCSCGELMDTDEIDERRLWPALERGARTEVAP